MNIDISQANKSIQKERNHRETYFRKSLNHNITEKNLVTVNCLIKRYSKQ